MGRVIKLTESQLKEVIKNVIREESGVVKVTTTDIINSLKDINMEEDVPNVNAFVNNSIKTDDPNQVTGEVDSKVPPEEQKPLKVAKEKLKRYFCSSTEKDVVRNELKNSLRELRRKKRELRSGKVQQKQEEPVNEQSIGAVLMSTSFGSIATVALILLVIYLLVKLVFRRRTCGGWYGTNLSSTTSDQA